MNKPIPSAKRAEIYRNDFMVEEGVAGPLAANSTTPMAVSRLDTARTADISAVCLSAVEDARGCLDLPDSADTETLDSADIELLGLSSGTA